MGKSTLGIISANYTRKALDKLVEDRTVATIPFGGRYRMIDFPLSNFVNSGIGTVGLITPYFYRSIMDHVGAGKPWELAKKKGGLFILPGTVYGERSQNSRFLLRDIINNKKILDRSHSDYVLCCDTSTVMNADLRPFIDAHDASGCPITLMYKTEKGRTDRAYLKIKKDGKLSAIVRDDNKESKLFMGCFIVNRDFMMRFIDLYAALDNNDFIDILAKNLDQYSVNTYEFKGYSAIIDSIDDYKRASKDLLNKKIRGELFEQDRVILTKVQDEAPTIYRSSAKVKNSLIAAGCIIEGTVEDSIIFRATHIKKGAVVKDSIVMQKNTIEENATVINAICDKYSQIGRKTVIEGGENKPIVLGKNTII